MEETQATDNRLELAGLEGQVFGIPGTEDGRRTARLGQGHHRLRKVHARDNGPRWTAAALSHPGPQATSSRRVPGAVPTASKMASLTCDVTGAVA
jgi:hypothetical protein